MKNNVIFKIENFWKINWKEGRWVVEMLYIGLGIILVNVLFVCLNIFSIFMKLLKLREREVGRKIEYIVKMFCM